MKTLIAASLLLALIVPAQARPFSAYDCGSNGPGVVFTGARIDIAFDDAVTAKGSRHVNLKWGPSKSGEGGYKVQVNGRVCKRSD